MPNPMVDTSDHLVADALHLAISLDSFTTLDWLERIEPAVQHADVELAALQRRRALLILSRADDAIVDWTLEVINARVAFLKQLRHRNIEIGPVPMLTLAKSRPEDA